MKYFYLICLVILPLLTLAWGCGDDDDDDDDDDLSDDDDDDDDNQPPIFAGLVSVEADVDSAVLSWDEALDPSTPITYYIYLANESGGQDFNAAIASTQELSVEVTGLKTCWDYYFIVRAKDSAGNEDDNTVEKSAKIVNYDCGYTQGDRLAWSFVPPQGPYTVETVGWIEDVNGDGLPDVLSHAYDLIEMPDGAKTTFCLSGGAKGPAQVIWSVSPTNDSVPSSDSGGDGDKTIIASGDLNADGFQDVLLATAWGNETAYALNGLTGETLWLFNTRTNPASPDSGWIFEILPYPDVTGDQVPEVVFGVGSDNDSGWLVNGASGEVLWHLGASDDVIYGAAPLDDIDGDQAIDAVFAGGDNEDRVFAVSGASVNYGTVLWSTATGNNYSLAVIDDVDGDGVKDVLAGSWNRQQVVCLSGVDGGEVWGSEVNLSPMRIVPLDDVNGDGVADVATAGMLSQFVAVLDGADGTQIWLEAGESTDLLWAVDRIEDVSGDGINDVVGGSFNSWVMAFDGADGATLWAYDTGSAKVMTIRGVPDMTGDCVPDVVVGTQCLSDSTPGAGTVFLLNGCP